MRRRLRWALGVGLLTLATAVAGCGPNQTLPPASSCLASTKDHSVSVTPEQAYYAAIIAGQSQRRGLPARAASIAIATVYQESGIRNLDYGDRDSVGLFQQRPSQGWGTVKQIMDPYYSTNKFYDALIKIRGWQSGDINDMAQAVQRSGFPDAYRQHESNARALASVLTGHSPSGLTCLNRSDVAGNPDGLVKFWNRNRAKPLRGKVSERTLTVVATSTTDAWSLAHQALATSHTFGVVSVQVGDRQTNVGTDQMPTWTAATTPVKATTVVVTVR